MYTYFDLISLPLSYPTFPHLPIVMGMSIYLTISSYVGAIYFRTAKFWESISDYLINCVQIDFARRLYSFGVLHIPKKLSKEENMVSGPRLF